MDTEKYAKDIERHAMAMQDAAEAAWSAHKFGQDLMSRPEAAGYELVEKGEIKRMQRAIDHRTNETTRLRERVRELNDQVQIDARVRIIAMQYYEAHRQHMSGALGDWRSEELSRQNELFARLEGYKASTSTTPTKPTP